ncbi:MAG: hypothetical protein IPH03_11615 [Tetrasphaera sp.]|nr:hypothetical protein [Tetrasphaera sp.]
MRLLARLGLRARLATIGIVGVAAALLLGFALLYAALTVSLGRAVDGQSQLGGQGSRGAHQRWAAR